jgi:hypothetical protein
MAHRLAGKIAVVTRAARPGSAWPSANFYSISNCQDGLRGASFDNFLIKQVGKKLQAEFPQLTRFFTLSPVPGFRRWLMQFAEGSDLDTALLPKLGRDGAEREVAPRLDATVRAVSDAAAVTRKPRRPGSTTMTASRTTTRSASVVRSPDVDMLLET